MLRRLATNQSIFRKCAGFKNSGEIRENRKDQRSVISHEKHLCCWTQLYGDHQIILQDGVTKGCKIILSRRSEYFQRMCDIKSQFVEQKESFVRFSCKNLTMKKICIDFHRNYRKVKYLAVSIWKLEFVSEQPRLSRSW